MSKWDAAELLILAESLVPFCMAGVAFPDILMYLIKCQKSLCVTGALFASFSGDELHLWWQVQHFGDLHHHFVWRACCVACFVRIAWSGLGQVATSKLCGRHGTFCESHFDSEAVGGAKFGADLLCVESHSAWQGLYSGPSTLDTLHFTLCTLHFTICTLDSRL